jgi:hypothetical protein
LLIEMDFIKAVAAASKEATAKSNMQKSKYIW